MRTRVKICGITRTEDALAAVQSGADAIGLVFYPPSPRAVDLDQASQIVAQLPPFVSVVGLFVDESAERIAEILARVPLGLLQFHGNETPAQCGGHGRPWIKAIRMRGGVDLLAEAERFADAAGLLLDSYQPGKPGGTGSTFSWDRIPLELAPNIILAGVV